VTHTHWVNIWKTSQESCLSLFYITIAQGLKVAGGFKGGESCSAHDGWDPFRDADDDDDDDSHVNYIYYIETQNVKAFTKLKLTVRYVF
jgi:hypothetical protein